MNSKVSVARMVVAVLFCSISLFAHHGTNISYQSDQSITLTGVATEWAYAYPHPQIYLDVKDASGKVTAWSLSSLSPGAASRAGVTRANFGQGQVVTVLA